LPFGRGVFAYGEPIRVPADAGRQTMEEMRRELQETLERLTEQAERLARGGSGTP